MSQVQNYQCDVCGTQAGDHSRWLLVSDQPRAHNIDILSWDDKLAAQPGICHLCCADHVQVLVSTWMMPDLGIPTGAEAAEPSSEDPMPLLRQFEIERACLSSGLETDRESLLAMLDAVEVVLSGTGAGDEEEVPPKFDA
jgi:hypothetical protein